MKETTMPTSALKAPYTKAQVKAATLEYFHGDEMATDTCAKKYLLKDNSENQANYWELTPNDMHHRIARELARVEKKKGFKNPLSEVEIFEYIRDFKRIIPQGSPMFGIGNPFQYITLSNCVHGESLVYTQNRGLIKMRDVRAGDMVLTHKGRFRKVVKQWSNGFKKTVTVCRTFSKKQIPVRDESEMSRYLSATPDHRIMTRDGQWTTVADYQNKHNKRLAQPTINYTGETPSFLPVGMGRHIEVDENFMWVMGLYLAEGAIKNTQTTHPSTYFTLHAEETEYAEKISSFAEKTFGSKAWIQNWPEYNFIQVNIFDPAFANLLDLICGHGFLNKRVPQWVFGLPTELKRAFLDGFLAGDATNYEDIDDDTNRFLTANPTMSYELGLVARSIGKNVRYNFLAKGRLIKHRSITTTICNKDDLAQFVECNLEVEVFDMEVEEDHSFVAGDIVCHNCYVLPSPLDSYGGICMLDQQIVQVSKRRGGTGWDNSNLRPAKSVVHNAAQTSSGMLEFAERFSHSIREVAQEGRRGASMQTLSVHHPEILEWANAKMDEKKITGSNISIRLTDEFLQAVKDDKDYELRWPVDAKEPKIRKMISARKVWQTIIHCAWSRGEPGLLFWDRIIKESPADCYFVFGFGTTSTNPCCFDEEKDVWVITKSGIKEIKQITKDDLIWVQESKTWEETSGYFHAGESDVYSVEFENGENLFVTANHKLTTVKEHRNGSKIEHLESDLVPVSSLQTGSKIAVHVSPVENMEWPKLGSYEEGVVLGWLTGDGCLSYHDEAAAYPSTILDFWSHEHDAGEFVKKVLEQIGYNLSLQPNNVNGVRRISSEKFTADFTNKYHCNPWIFKSSNLQNPFLFQASRDFTKGFLSSYFSADGTVTCNHEAKSYAIQLGSINRNRLQQVKQLLLCFGIKSSIGLAREAGEAEFDGQTYETKDCWRLSISGIENIRRFATEIGMICKHKSNLLADICKVFAERTPKCWTYTKIVSIQKVGIKRVGCIEVKNHHKFTANGIISGNSELPLCPFDSCRLLLLNLATYVLNPFTTEAKFDFEWFAKDAMVAQRFMDDLVDLELECIDRIIAKIDSDPEPEEIKAVERNIWVQVRLKCEQGRRTGTGITALGDTFAALNIAYGSDQSIAITDEIYRTLKLSCYRSSVEMAKELGAFPIWNHELEKNNPFLLRIRDEDPQLWEDMKKHGRRNISLLTTAPAGTVSIVAQTTSGIEPEFSLFYERYRKINPDEEILPDRVDKNGDAWKKYSIEANRPFINLWRQVSGEKDIKKSPWAGSTSADINWTARVRLQAAATKHVDHSISSTVNLPREVTEETVAVIYETAWESGCKGLTVYREGCRDGVMISSASSENDCLDCKDASNKLLTTISPDGRPTRLVHTTAPRRPKILPCDIHRCTIEGKSWVFLVGIKDDAPFEVFGGHPRNFDIPRKYKKGWIEKDGKLEGRTCYDLILGDLEDEEERLVFRNIGKLLDRHQWGPFTRIISWGLRHGGQVKHLCKTIVKDDESNMHSFARVVARVFKTYIAEGESAGGECPECHGTQLVYRNGCPSCKSCEWTQCS